MAMINMNVMALSLSPLNLSFSPSLLSLSLSSSPSPSSSSSSSSSSSLSSPSPVSSTNHETIMTLCKKRHIVLDYNHPEYVINFPITSTDNTDNKNYKSSKENYLLSDEKISERKFPYPLDFHINKNTPTSHCQWLIITDPYHRIGAEIKVNNESDYFLNITNENDLQKNCTIKTCLIRSDKPAILVQFHIKQLNHFQSDSGFSAKFVIIPLSSNQSDAVIIIIWILLLSFITLLIIFATIFYLYCMKKKLLFSQLLTILRSKNRKNKPESKDRKITLSNGTLIKLAYKPGQYGCCITSPQLNSFQRMPTILEETENDIESRISSQELNETYAVVQHTS